METVTMDAVFKALADPSRRRLLDRLNERNGLTLAELCEGMNIARQSVAKHLAMLEAAGLISSRRQGREKLHFLNAAPINDVAERWMDSYHSKRAEALADLKRALEDTAIERSTFAYATYVKTTPGALWRALTDPAFTLRYWGVGLHSDWRVGSPILWRESGEKELEDRGAVVLEAEPQRRLAYTWPRVQQYHADVFGWSAERLAELQREPPSSVCFEIEPSDGAIKLTVTHGGFAAGSPLLEAVSGRTPQSGGWPELLANLKTLLETGAPMRLAAAAA
jgi:DNA-binding transcriptional ArsR family regulator/uncharacterized protein YndB with AHSA1/START domain